MWKQYKSNFISIQKKEKRKASEPIFLSLFSFAVQAYSFRSLEADYLHNTIKEILEILPNEFDLSGINAKYPITKTCSLNLVLAQEVRQYNQLLKYIRNDTVQVFDAIQGKILYTFLFVNTITTTATTAPILLLLLSSISCVHFESEQISSIIFSTHSLRTLSTIASSSDVKRFRSTLICFLRLSK